MVKDFYKDAELVKVKGMDPYFYLSPEDILEIIKVGGKDYSKSATDTPFSTKKVVQGIITDLQRFLDTGDMEIIAELKHGLQKELDHGCYR